MMRNREWRGAAFAAVAVACIVLAGLFSPSAMAQDTMQVIQNAPGFKASMSYSSFGNGENVNVLSGALIVTHPSAVSLPQNHGGMLSFARVYNDRSYETVFGAGGATGADPKYGFTGKRWRVGFGRVICRYIYQQVSKPTPHTDSVLHYFYVDESGAEHALFGGPCPYQCDGSPCPRLCRGGPDHFLTNDGSYLRAEHSADPNVWTIFYPDGSKRVLEHLVTPITRTLYTLPYIWNWAQEGWYTTKIYDSFSNLLQITYNGYNLNTQPFGDSIATITDQFNRVVTFHEDSLTHLLVSVSWAAFGGATATEYYQYDNGVIKDGNDQPDGPFLIGYTDPAGLEVRYDYHWEFLGSDSTGGYCNALTSIAYPTGAVAQYSYATWHYWSLPPGLPWHGDPDGNPQDMLIGAGIAKRTVLSDDNSLSWTYWRGGATPHDTELGVGNFVVLTGPDGRAETHSFYYNPFNSSGDDWMTGREIEVDQYSQDFVPSATSHPGLVHSKLMTYEWSYDGDAQYCLTDNLGLDAMPPSTIVGGNARVYQTVEREYDPSNGAQLSQRTTKSTGWDGYGHYEQTDTSGSGIVGDQHAIEFSAYNLSLQTAQSGPGAAYILNMKTSVASGWGVVEPFPSDWRVGDPPYQTLNGTVKVRYYVYDSSTGALTQAIYKKPQYTIVPGDVARSAWGTWLFLGVPDSLQAGDVTTTVSYYLVGDIAAGNIQSVIYSGGDAPQGGSTMSFTQTFTWDHGMVSSASTPGLPYATDLTRTIDSNTSLITSTSDPNGITTSFSYDILGRLTTITPQDGDYSTYISYPMDSRTYSYTYDDPMAGEPQTVTTTWQTGHDILFYQGPEGFTPSDDVSGIDAGASYAHYVFDDLGRLVITKSLHPADSSNPSGYLTDTMTAYDPWGAVFLLRCLTSQQRFSFTPWIGATRWEPAGARS